MSVSEINNYALTTRMRVGVTPTSNMGGWNAFKQPLIILWTLIVEFLLKFTRKKPNEARQPYIHSTEPTPHAPRGHWPVNPLRWRGRPANGYMGEGKMTMPRLMSAPGATPFRKKTLVLDLDETLVHSSPIILSPFYDLYFEIYIDRRPTQFYVYKRPFVDLFLREVARWYNVVLYTASVREYAEPVIDALDPVEKMVGGARVIKSRLYRESCHLPHFSKDLSLVDNDLTNVLIVDNSPLAYTSYPDNAIPIETWISNKDDTQLADLIPFLEALHKVDDVRSILKFRNINQVRR